MDTDLKAKIKKLASDNPDFSDSVKKAFPEAFEREPVNLWAANGDSVDFMGDLLGKAGLNRAAIFIAHEYAKEVGLPDGSGFFFMDRHLKKPRIFDHPQGWLVTIDPKE